MTSKFAYHSPHFSMKSSCVQGVKVWIVAVAMLSVGDVRGADDNRPWPTDSSPKAIGGDLFGSVQPFENTLGMRFLSVPGTQVLFSIWDTRVQDYQVFARATSTDWPSPEFQQGPTHPAINVSWLDAKRFCEWLTGKERAEGKIRPDQEYRLPTDVEWSGRGFGGREGQFAE
jgi:Sulfatase-modifying factor enzyme 1